MSNDAFTSHQAKFSICELTFQGVAHDLAKPTTGPTPFVCARSGGR